MKVYRAHSILLLVLVFTLPMSISLYGADFLVERYGAVGDGVTLNTSAILSAIDACAEAGGGRVVLTAGTYLSGTLVMKKPDRYRKRPYLIRFTQCSDITVKDLTLKNSAMWMQHYLACEGISISNCVLSSHCNAIKMGTESTGGFINITIHDCVIKPSSEKQVIYGLPEGISGISLEVVDGGVMEGIVISDVVMDGPEVPLFIRLGNRARPHREGAIPGPGQLGQVRIEHIRAKNAGTTGCSVSGIPGLPARDITLKDISLQFRGGIAQNDIPQLPPELEELYPDARDHLVAVDVKGLSQQGFEISKGVALRRSEK